MFRRQYDEKERKEERAALERERQRELYRQEVREREEAEAIRRSRYPIQRRYLDGAEVQGLLKELGRLKGQKDWKIIGPERGMEPRYIVRWGFRGKTATSQIVVSSDGEGNLTISGKNSSEVSYSDREGLEDALVEAYNNPDDHPYGYPEAGDSGY